MPEVARDDLAGSDRARSRVHLACFRFVFVFIGLVALDVLAQVVQRMVGGAGGTESPESFTGYLWRLVIPWIGVHVLHLAHAVKTSYGPGRAYVGGDSVFEYMLRGTQVGLAAIAAVVWGLLDKGRRHYRTLDGYLDAYLRVFVRVALAAEMLSYGLAKVPPTQFGWLTLDRQAQHLGELGPMMMLWAFMAASPGYALVCGLVEVAGGLLLLWRRTTMLGALLSLGAMGNVFVLNVFYDVNQKMRSLLYVLLALYLAAPLLPGLWRLLVMQQPAVPVTEAVPPGRRWVRRGLLALPAVFALLTAAVMPADWRRYHAAQMAATQRPADYGIWQVDRFTVAAGHTPLLSDESLKGYGLEPGQDTWREVIFEAAGKVYLEMESGQYNTVQASEDAATGETVLTDPGDKDWKVRLRFRRDSATKLVAEGTVNGNAVGLAMTRVGDGMNHPMAKPRWLSDGQRW